MASLEKFKLQSATWDSDKEPNRFVQFMYLISVPHIGYHLENWLVRKLGRARHQGTTTPSFLSDDPEFQQPNGAASEDEDCDNASVSTNGSQPAMRVSTGSPHATLNAAGASYFDEFHR